MQFARPRSVFLSTRSVFPFRAAIVSAGVLRYGFFCCPRLPLWGTSRPRPQGGKGVVRRGPPPTQSGGPVGM